jgi:hypothetical protein
MYPRGSTYRHGTDRPQILMNVAVARGAHPRVTASAIVGDSRLRATRDGQSARCDPVLSYLVAARRLAQIKPSAMGAFAVSNLWRFA